MNRVGVFEQGDFWDTEDLKHQLSVYDHGVPDTYRPNVISVDGGDPLHKKCAQNGYACGESMLDIDIIIPLVYPQNVTIFQVGAPRHDAGLGAFNTFLDAVCAGS